MKMPEDRVDLSRRNALKSGVAVTGGIALGAAAVPFIQSMNPSARAQAYGGPIDVDIANLQPGELKVAQWRGLPVWVFRRTPEMLATMKSQEDRLKDPVSETESQQPDYARNDHRSIKPEYLIVVGICTHLGCSPALKPEADFAQAPDWWKGGFYCACHRSKYDFAGRVFDGDSPAPANLPVPSHYFVSETVVRIGVSEGEDVS